MHFNTPSNRPVNHLLTLSPFYLNHFYNYYQKNYGKNSFVYNRPSNEPETPLWTNISYIDNSNLETLLPGTSSSLGTLGDTISQELAREPSMREDIMTKTIDLITLTS